MEKKFNFSLMMKVMLGVIVLSVGLIVFVQCSAAKSSDLFKVENIELVQLEEPEDDRDIAVISTEYGDMYVALYEEYAPNTVKNFVELANKGYYDNTYFFAVATDVYTMGGSPNNDGSVRKESFGDKISKLFGKETYDFTDEKIPNEYSEKMWPLKGAMVSLSHKQGFGGSRFLLTGSIEFTGDLKEEFEKIKTSQELKDAFLNYGGVPNLSGKYTVYGQTIKGLDVLDKILALYGDKDNNFKPEKDIMINSIKITKYKEVKDIVNFGKEENIDETESTKE